MDNAANKCKQMQTWQLQLSGRDTRDITKIDRNGVEWQMKVIRILFSFNSPQENWSMYRLLLQLVSLMLDRRASRVQDWKTNATRTPVLQTTLEDPDSDPQIAGSRVGFREISPSGITHPIRSMVLVYMLTWMGYIDGTHVTIYGHDMLYWWYISIYCPYYPFIIHIYKYIYVTYTILYGSYGHDHSIIWDPQTLQQKLQGRFHHWQVVRHISCAPEDEWYHKPTTKHIMLFSSLLKNMLDYWIPTLLSKVSTCDMLWWYI
jgi:hypothetical protein